MFQGRRSRFLRAPVNRSVADAERFGDFRRTVTLRPQLAHVGGAYRRWTALVDFSGLRFAMLSRGSRPMPRASQPIPVTISMSPGRRSPEPFEAPYGLP
jgi:hypothetical protein